MGNGHLNLVKRPLRGGQWHRVWPVRPPCVPDISSFPAIHLWVMHSVGSSKFVQAVGAASQTWVEPVPN